MMPVGGGSRVIGTLFREDHLLDVAPPVLAKKESSSPTKKVGEPNVPRA
jgi:hypothetical protein